MTPTSRRFLDSVIGKITKFKHGFEKNSPAKEKERQKKIFISEINQKITGAIDGKRRYGWIFFFSEINDFQKLNEIDRIVEGLLKRIKGIATDDVKEIKKISRAYYEVNHSPKRGYIRIHQILG